VIAIIIKSTQDENNIIPGLFVNDITTELTAFEAAGQFTSIHVFQNDLLYFLRCTSVKSFSVMSFFPECIPY